ncbi:MAG: 50S ribosomal protein L13 [Candidatus Micrarchaeota archaeon]
MVTVIDGTDYIFGRLATRIAKKALQGEEIQLINAENIVVLGNPKQIRDRYAERRALVSKSNPEHAAKWPRVPHMLVKRMIRGMLPWKRTRGKDAYRRIIVHTGNPKKLTATEFQSDKYDGIAKHVTIKQMCESAGYQIRV